MSVDILKIARERFKLANEADAAQATRERDDLSFYAGDQWPADIKLSRMGQQPVNGMPAVPSRPTLVINKVKEPVRQVLNQERQSDIGIELTPADDFGDLGLTPDDTEITLREGLVRRIQRESHAQDARTWAFARAVTAGRGYYLVMTRYLPGATFDQEIYLHRIYNQAGVLLDPSHENPDGSDADYGFMGTWMLWDRYTQEYGKILDKKGSRYVSNPYSDYGEKDFMGLTEEYPDWYKAEGKERSVRVVDYWYTDRTSDEILLGSDDRTYQDETEMPEGVTVADRRTQITKTIRFCKIGGGSQLLEQTDWAGPDMPIVKVIGDEMQPYDGQRRAEGMIRPARDAQMGYNYMVSKEVETIGLTPISPLQVDPEAIDGYEAWYAAINTRTLPYLPHRTYDDSGRQLSPPTRAIADNNIMAMAQAINLFDASIKSTTAVPDASMGNVDPSLRSGKAIQAVVANAQMSTSNFMDNLSRSIRYEGQIINNLLYPIYGGKTGRLVRILTGEGDAAQMTIGEAESPSLLDLPPTSPMMRGMSEGAQQNGPRPLSPMLGQPMPGGPMPGPQGPMAAPPPTLAQKAAKVAKLTKDCHWNVLVKVTKSYDSRRTQEATVISQLLNANPVLMTWFGDLFFKNQDGPGHMQMSERAKVMLDPKIQAMLAQQEQNTAPIPPQVQAQLAQLQQQVKDAEQAMQALKQAADGKQLDAQTKLQLEQMKLGGDREKSQLDAQLALEIQRMKDASEIRIAEIKNATQAHVLLHEADAMDRTQAHEAALAAASAQHDLSVMQQEQDAAQQAQQAQQEAAEPPVQQAQEQQMGTEAPTEGQE